MFSKSPNEKCYPCSLPREAPANEASKVNTKGIFSWWNIVILAVDSFDFGILKEQSAKLKLSMYFCIM